MSDFVPPAFVDDLLACPDGAYSFASYVDDILASYPSITSAISLMNGTDTNALPSYAFQGPQPLTPSLPSLNLPGQEPAPEPLLNEPIYNAQALPELSIWSEDNFSANLLPLNGPSNLCGPIIGYPETPQQRPSRTYTEQDTMHASSSSLHQATAYPSNSPIDMVSPSAAYTVEARTCAPRDLHTEANGLQMVEMGVPSYSTHPVASTMSPSCLSPYPPSISYTHSRPRRASSSSEGSTTSSSSDSSGYFTATSSCTSLPSPSASSVSTLRSPSVFSIPTPSSSAMIIDSSPSPPATSSLRAKATRRGRKNTPRKTAPRSDQFVRRKPFPEIIDWTCSYCGFVQQKHRKPDLKRHVETHFRYTPPKWLCCGVPADLAKQYGVSERGALFSYVTGEMMVGGCGVVFGRKDTLARHLKAQGCIGDSNGPWLPGMKKKAKKN